MKNNVLTMAVAFLLISVISNNSFSAPLEPVFKINKISGECTVKKPGDGTAQNAVEGQAYPYGSEVITGRKSSAVIVFSELNECRIMANTKMLMTEDLSNKKLKLIKLEKGQVDLNLEESFHEKTGNDLSVETAAAICGAIGCKFSVQASSEADMKSAGVVVTDGKIFVKGLNFNVTSLDKDDAAVVSIASDQSYVSLKNVKGNFEVTIKDAQGNPRNIALKQNYVLRIFRKVNETTKQGTVTILVISPEGKTEESITRSFKLDDPTEPGLSNDPSENNKDGEKDQNKDQEKEDADDEEFPTTTTTTVASTTTTTISPKDKEIVDEDENRDGNEETVPIVPIVTTTTIPSVTPVGLL